MWVTYINSRKETRISNRAYVEIETIIQRSFPHNVYPHVAAVTTKRTAGLGT